MAAFNMTLAAINACGGGFTTVGPVPTPIGSVVQGSYCPVPSVEVPLNVTSIQVNQPYSASTKLRAFTSVLSVTGLPPGVTASPSSGPAPGGVVTFSGTPTQQGAYEIRVNATNACGGSSATTSMSLVVGNLTVTAAASSGIPPSGSGRYEASATAFTGDNLYWLDTGFRFMTNGVTEFINASLTTGLRPNWYLTTTAGIGNGYWIKVDVTSAIGSGPSRVIGTFGTWQQLNADRSFGHGVRLLGGETARDYGYRIRIATAADDNAVVADWTANQVYLDLVDDGSGGPPV